MCTSKHLRMFLSYAEVVGDELDGFDLHELLKNLRVPFENCLLMYESFCFVKLFHK